MVGSHHFRKLNQSMVLEVHTPLIFNSEVKELAMIISSNPLAWLFLKPYGEQLVGAILWRSSA